MPASPDNPGRPTPRQIAAFWSRVRTGALTECWPWTGSLKPESGYGRTMWGSRVESTHRIAFELTYGRPLAPGMEALHSCDRPECCNPLHITERDMFLRGRRRSKFVGSPTPIHRSTP